MTGTLETAIAKLAALPAEEQDRVGRWLLDELNDEELWDRQFGASQGALSKLAAEARADRADAAPRTSIPGSCEVARNAALLGRLR